jgi:hypothetical protein
MKELARPGTHPNLPVLLNRRFQHQLKKTRADWSERLHAVPSAVWCFNSLIEIHSCGSISDSNLTARRVRNPDTDSSTCCTSAVLPDSGLAAHQLKAPS